MTGRQYEYLYALYLKCMGYPQVIVTRGSGDQGVDVVAYKGYQKFAFQCKLQSTPVNNKAVQEVYAGAPHYECNRAIVVTNNTFTKSAKELAQSNKVTLVSGKTIESLVKICADGYKEGKFNSENDLLSHLPVDIQEAIMSEGGSAIKYIDTSIDSAKAGAVYSENELAEIAAIPEKSQAISMRKSDNVNSPIEAWKPSISNVKSANRVTIVARVNEVHRENDICPSTMPQYQNTTIKQPANNLQKNNTAILPLCIYIGGLMIKICLDVMCIIIPYACVLAILFTFLCVNPKWYQAKAYRVSNIIIGILLMCIGGVILMMGMPAINKLSNTFVYVKSDTYTDMFGLQALYYGGTLFVSALIFLCVRHKETPLHKS